MWILRIIFLISEEKFHVGSQLELQLEFRTSENTGVLLSVSEPEGYPALSLEINDGKVGLGCQTYEILWPIVMMVVIVILIVGMKGS
jgi:hypothetical protein